MLPSALTASTFQTWPRAFGISFRRPDRISGIRPDRISGTRNRYYGVPFTGRALSSFRRQVVRLWFKALRRRSQKTKLTWERMQRLRASSIHIPENACASTPEAGAGCGSAARPDLCGGRLARAVPTAPYFPPSHPKNIGRVLNRQVTSGTVHHAPPAKARATFGTRVAMST
jgi:hypothetical protein